MMEMEATRLLANIMSVADVPILFGPVPETAFPSYPLPHAPGQKIFDDAMKIIEAIQNFDCSEKVRHEAISLLLLQLYQHAYFAGAKHTLAA